MTREEPAADRPSDDNLLGKQRSTAGTRPPELHLIVPLEGHPFAYIDCASFEDELRLGLERRPGFARDVAACLGNLHNAWRERERPA